MLYMLIVKGSDNSEAGNLPSLELREAMSAFNKELVEAGVRVMAKGLYPSSIGMRISYKKPDASPEITEGPFIPSDEVFAGFILIEVQSHEEAVKWALKMPDPQGFGQGQVELRRVHE